MSLTRKLNYSETVAFLQKREATVRRFYITQDLTARIVAEKLNVIYDNNFQKALLRVIGSKNKGLGGDRPGSGNKKGIKFCGICRQQAHNCKCL